MGKNFIICTTFRTLLKIGTRFTRFFSNKIGHIPEVEWKVPGSDDECHSIGLRVEVGPVQQGDQAPTHCHLLGPGTDVPIGRREYTARLSTNKRGPYIFLLEGYQSATDVPFGQRENIFNQ